MGKILAVICTILVLLIAFLAIWSPETSNYPPTVNRTGQVKYKIGEKIKANPYGDWFDGTVTAITSEDEYIVKYCGDIGWFNHHECEEKVLRRSQMAKVDKDTPL